MLKDAIKKNYKWIIVFLCVVIFLLLLEDIFENEILDLDVAAYRMIVLNLRTDSLTGIMKVITSLGGAYVLIALTLGALLVLKNRKISIMITLNLVISTVLNFLLKYVIERPRPEGYGLIIESGYSFPSGHSMISMAFYGLIIYLIWKLVKKENIKYICSVFLGLLIVLIGFSRIYLGVHYASDVIGGFAIAIAYLIVFTSIAKTYLKEIDGEKHIMKKNTIKLLKKKKKLTNSFKYAFEGIASSLKTEQNLKIHFAIMIVVIIAGIICRISVFEWIICVILFGLVIAFELINTAIETTVDLAMPDKHPKAKLAKDISAGAVLILAITAIIVGLIIFIPKIF